MSYSQEVIAKCEYKFVYEGKTGEQIEKETGVPMGTVYRWKNKYSWDNLIKDGGQIGIALKVQKEFIEEIRTAITQGKMTDPGTVDRLTKLSKVVERLMPKATTLSNIYNLFEALVEFVTNHSDERFIKLFQKYTLEMSDYLRSKFTQ